MTSVSFAFKHPTYFCCLIFSRTCRSGVHLPCVSLRESEAKIQKKPNMPPVIINRNSGSLLQIQQSAWPGRQEQSDRQTGDGWHTVTTLTASPSSLGVMDTTRNAKKQQKQKNKKRTKPSTHATGGKQPTRHAPVCPLGSSSCNSLKTKSPATAATGKPKACWGSPVNHTGFTPLSLSHDLKVRYTCYGSPFLQMTLPL